MSIEAAMGSRAPFDARIHEIRGQQGQIDTAAIFRALLGPQSQISGITRKLRKKYKTPTLYAVSHKCLVLA